MHPFKAGDLVVCIDDKPVPGKIVRPGEPWLCAGRAYRIASVSSCSVTGKHGVMLLGLGITAPAVGWHAWRFRKIELADEAFCEELKARLAGKLTHEMTAAL